MALALKIESTVVGVIQQINATKYFDGEPPVGTPVIRNGCNIYAPQDGGGLFYFENTEPIVVVSATMDFGSSLAWELYKVNCTDVGVPIPDEDWLIDSGTSRSVVLVDSLTGLILGNHQALQLVVAAGTARMTAEFFVKQARNW